MSRSEFDGLLPTRDFDRRSFVKTAVGSGLAAAVPPVSAQTIRTDTGGLTAGPVTVTMTTRGPAGTPIHPPGRSGVACGVPARRP